MYNSVVSGRNGNGKGVSGRDGDGKGMIRNGMQLVRVGLVRLAGVQLSGGFPVGA